MKLKEAWSLVLSQLSLRLGSRANPFTIFCWHFRIRWSIRLMKQADETIRLSTKQRLIYVDTLDFESICCTMLSLLAREQGSKGKAFTGKYCSILTNSYYPSSCWKSSKVIINIKKITSIILSRFHTPLHLHLLRVFMWMCWNVMDTFFIVLGAYGFKIFQIWKEKKKKPQCSHL